MKVPCELTIWYLLPEIRSEIARCLVDRYGYSQKEVAARMGVTPATICQYFKQKRGHTLFVKIKNPKLRREFMNEITRSALRIEEERSPIEVEICRICRAVKKGDLIMELYKTFEKVDVPSEELLFGHNDTKEYRCKNCHEEIEKGWKACPHCGNELLAECPSCKKEIEVGWKVCPHCTIELTK